MNTIGRFRLSLAILIVAALLCSACSYELAPATKNLPTLQNALGEDNKLIIEHAIPGEKFDFITAYSTDYDAQHWHLTDSKTLRMEARIKINDGDEQDAQVIVLVEHVHIDVSILAKYASINGWKTDSMDDSVHGGDQPGFWITEDHPYENVFAIEGYSKTMIEGWSYFTGSYGSGSIKETRLTEHNLTNPDNGTGAYGNKFTIVYDLLVKYPGEEYYYTHSLVDEFVVPVAAQ